jgi:transcriptional regulator
VYLPRHFTMTDLAAVAAFVDAAGAADLVTFDGSRPVATLLPVIWDRPAGFPDPDAGHGVLVGHLALANPQWQTVQPDSMALAIVHGPQAYVSPSWYESKTRHGRVVPTWNYETVHLTGRLTVHRDPEWLRTLVSRLTRRHEEPRAQPWAVTDAPPEFVNGQLKGIVGVELAITTVEAKDKLSQNRSAMDQAGVVEGLREQDDPEAVVIADHIAANLRAAGEPAP